MCSLGCLQCIEPLVCTECEVGTYLSSDSICVYCPTQCSECDSDSCKKCKDSASLYEDICVKCDK